MPANFNPINGRVNYIPPDNDTGNIQSWHVTLQRELRQPVRRRRRLRRQPEPPPDDPRRLQPGAAERQRREHAAAGAPADSGLSVHPGGVRRRQGRLPRAAGEGRAPLHRGLYLLNSFTWSRARDNASGHLETANGDNSRVNFADLDAEFGLSGYNQPLNNTTTVVWELPFGRDRRWASTCRRRGRGHPRRLAADGHQHDDERPAGQPELLAGGGVQRQRRPTYRPNLIGDIYAPEGEQSITNWFNQANMTIPTDSTQPFGNAPRNVARGPALYMLDLGLHKSFGAGRQEPPRVPHRSVQRAEQDQLRRAEQQRLGDQLRHHHRPGDAGAAGAARRQVRLLMVGGRALTPGRGRALNGRAAIRDAGRVAAPPARGRLAADHELFVVSTTVFGSTVISLSRVATSGVHRSPGSGPRGAWPGTSRSPRTSPCCSPGARSRGPRRARRGTRPGSRGRAAR